MAQKVTLKVAGKVHELEAEFPEMERLMRLSAEEVNRKLAEFDARYPMASLDDKLAFVAVQLGVSWLWAERELDHLKEDLSVLDQQLSSYLDTCE